MNGDHALRKMVKHLEFLGYRAEVQDDGWTFVSHPTRPDFFVRDFPFGIRAVAMFTLDRVVCDPEWLAFVNKCNELGTLSSFSLVFKKDGSGTAVRVVTVLPRAYDKPTFGAWVDAWHEDLALLRNAPEREEAAVVAH